MTPTPQQNNPTALDLIKQWLDERPELGKWANSELYNNLDNGINLAIWTQPENKNVFAVAKAMYHLPTVNTPFIVVHHDGKGYNLKAWLGSISSPTFFQDLERAIKENMK